MSECLVAPNPGYAQGAGEVGHSLRRDALDLEVSCPPLGVLASIIATYGFAAVVLIASGGTCDRHRDTEVLSNLSEVRPEAVVYGVETAPTLTGKLTAREVVQGVSLLRVSKTPGSTVVNVTIPKRP